jgi:hypothetical protein
MDPTIEPNANVERPRVVSKAVQFLTSALAIGLLNAIFTLVQKTSGIPMLVALIIVTMVFGIGFVLILRISTMRRMRIVSAVLLTLSAAFAVVAFRELFWANYVAALAFAVASALAYAVYKRRNWARIVVLILVLCNVPFAILAYPAEVRKNVLSGSLSIIIVLLQLIGTYLLFTKNSNLWFRTRK